MKALDTFSQQNARSTDRNLQIGHRLHGAAQWYLPEHI